MPIGNDQELITAAAQASTHVQDIHNYCGRALRDDSKINFPRGLIGTADSYRARCPGYLDAETASSCAYGFMHMHVMWWLVSRTDLASVGKQMALKSAIVSLGTILEAVLKIPGLPRNKWLSEKSSAGVRARVDEVVKRGRISADEGTTLKELWVNRNNVHLHLLPGSERDIYNSGHINGPLAALSKLMARLKALHAGGTLIVELSGAS
jgi:hypothetical protein